MDDLISKLSEIRSEYNCFDEDEEPYYRALSEAIKILSQPEDGDTISRQAAINTVSNWLRAVFGVNSNANTIGVFRELRELPSAEPDWEEMLVICDCCGHAIHVKRLKGESGGA